MVIVVIATIDAVDVISGAEMVPFNQLKFGENADVDQMATAFLAQHMPVTMVTTELSSQPLQKWNAYKVHSVVAISSRFTFIRTQNFSLTRHTNAIIYILPFTPLRNHSLSLYLTLVKYAPTEPVSKILALISFHDREQFMPGSLASVKSIDDCIYMCL